MPDFDHCVRHRVTSLHVDDLGIKDKIYAFLTFGDVFADVFAGDVVRTLGHFGAQNARIVAGEEDCLVGCASVALG